MNLEELINHGVSVKTCYKLFCRVKIIKIDFATRFYMGFMSHVL